MKCYEHCTALKPMEMIEKEFLDSWGNAGWQLVSVISYQYQNQYYFKREIITDIEFKPEGPKEFKDY